jgi:hypothetical protein
MSEITRERLDELERIAQAATPDLRLRRFPLGPDGTEQGGLLLFEGNDPYHPETIAKIATITDREFFDTFNRATILALITALRAAWEREGRMATEAQMILDELQQKHDKLSDDGLTTPAGGYHRRILSLTQAFTRLGLINDTQHATGDENVSQDVQDA